VGASQRGRIRLIDDDRALGGYLTRILTRGGFAVTHELERFEAIRDRAGRPARPGAETWAVTP
jgi:hypothetical protein